MNIGRVLLIPKGDYNGATNYMMLDWVRHNGASWVCKVDNTIGIAPSSSTSTNWQILAEDGSVSGSVDWNTGVTNKPFSSVSATDFDVDAVTDELSIKGYGNKADKSTTLAGYGITDAYTKTTVDSALAAKLTTPAGGSPGNALIKDASGNPAWGSVGADFISSVSNEFDVPSSGSDKGKLSLSSSITSKLVNEVNPTLAGTEDAVEGLNIGGTKYKVGGGHTLDTSVATVEGTTSENQHVPSSYTLKQYANRLTYCVESTLTANTNEITIPSSGNEPIFEDDDATFEFMYEPNGTDSYPMTLTRAQITTTTGQGKVVLTFEKAPTVATKVRVDVTRYREVD